MRADDNRGANAQRFNEHTGQRRELDSSLPTIGGFTDRELKSINPHAQHSQAPYVETAANTMQLSTSKSHLHLQETLPDLGNPTELTYEIGAKSSIGKRRRNEDRCAVLDDNFCAVSDGIGGSMHGDVAAAIAVNASCDAYRDARLRGIEIEHSLVVSLLEADRRATLASRWMGREGDGTGATLLLAALENSSLYLLSVGDCQAYLLRQGTLMSLVRIGRTDPRSNRLKNAIGYGANLSPECTSIPLAHGDRILLATDGVWDAIGSDLSGLLSQPGTAPEIAGNIADTGARYGSDNSTAVVIIVRRSE